MTVNIRSFAPGENTDEVAEAVRKDGVALFRGHGAAAAPAVRAELDPFFEIAPYGAGDFMGRRTKRVGGVIARSEAFRTWATDQDVLRQVGIALRPRSTSHQINLTQAICIDPGEEAQVLHRDDVLFPIPREPDAIMVHVMWAVTPFTAENGATRVAPGSHLWPEERMPEPSDVLTVPMDPGDALLMVGGLLHGGGANTSSAGRLGIICSYVVGWLRQAENQYLAVPFEIARALPEQLQRLLGYQLHRPNLGWVDGQDPILALKGESALAMPPTDNAPTELEAQLAEVLANRAHLRGLFEAGGVARR